VRLLIKRIALGEVGTLVHLDGFFDVAFTVTEPLVADAEREERPVIVRILSERLFEKIYRFFELFDLDNVPAARAIFDNEEGRLYAGVFVRVRVVGKPQPDRILVEERAIGTDLAGKYVMVVDEKDVAQRRYIVPGQLEGTMRVVLEGLKGNERYITIGTLRARPGLPVNPVEMAAES